MRRVFWGLAIVLGLSASASTSYGQNGGFSDPFFLYYGFFLPRQAALATQQGPEMMINNQAAAMQQRALTDRAGLLDPLSNFGGDEFDMNRPFADRSRGARFRRTPANGLTNTSINGSGPASHYNRTMSYYPTLRTGRMAARSNLPSSGRMGRGSYTGINGMGGGGMPGMNPGMPNLGGMR
jgi:hypothetical protein